MSTPIPRPGQHLPGTRPAVDPARVHAQIDELLAAVRDDAHDSSDAITDQTGLLRRAELLEQAHDVLVQALSTVDKI